MGLFDFLKNNEPSETPDEPSQQSPQPYLGDLTKTDILYKLVAVPQAERDENWQQTFVENLAKASFRCGEPQVITGPDGLPYFQLFLPEPHTAFNCFVIERMVDDFLLSSGIGVVINPQPNSADWVLTYGEVLNFHLNKTFYTNEDTPFSKKKTDEVVAEDEKIMIAQPSEAILPKLARHHIAEFLKMNGISSPKVLLMARKNTIDNSISQDIVFNITQNSFKDPNAYKAVMRIISWYLPKHYSFAGIDEDVFGEGFKPL